MIEASQRRGSRQPAYRRLAAFLLDPRLRRKLGGQLISAAVHLLILLILASITLSSGDSSGLGLPGFRGASISLGRRPADDLERLISKIENRPRQVTEPEVERPKLPELPALAPISTAARADAVRAHYVVGGGLIGLGGSFGKFIGGLRRRGLDVALVIDASGSMQNVIDEIKQGMIELVDDIRRLVPTARVSAVAFRDRGEDFVVRWSDLSFHGSKTKAFLSQIKAEGGGDWRDAVGAALETALTELTWRKRSKKVIILVGSSPPHRETLPEIRRLVAQFHRDGGIVSTIDVSERLHVEYEKKLHEWLYGVPPKKISKLPSFYHEVQQTYREIAELGGGEMAGVNWNKKLTNEILVFAFGSRWRAEVAKVTRR